MVVLIRRIALAAAALTATACSALEPTFHDCAITCTAATGCPDGYTCAADGFCHTADESPIATCALGADTGPTPLPPDAAASFPADAAPPPGHPDATPPPPPADASPPPPPPPPPPPDASPPTETFCSEHAHCTKPGQCCLHIDDYGICVDGTPIGTDVCIPA